MAKVAQYKVATNSQKMPGSSDIISDKKCLALFCNNSLKVSELFYMNSKIIQLLFSKFCILVNLLKTGAF